MTLKKIKINTLINSAGKFVSFLFQLFIITYLVRQLGQETYGILALALALAANTNLLESGFGLSATKYVAEYHARSDRGGLLRIVNTNMLVSTVLALFFSLVLLVINEFYVDSIFTLPRVLVGEAKGLIRVLICLSVIEFWSSSIVRVAEGFQRFIIVRTIEIGKWLLRSILVVIMCQYGLGLMGVGFAYLAAGIITLVILFFSVFTSGSGLVLSMRYVDKKTFHQLFGFSIWIFLGKMFSFLAYKIDTIILGIFLPPANITLYNIAYKIYEFLRFGFSLLSSTLVSITSELSALSETAKMRLLYKKATKYTALIMFPILIIAYVHAEDVIRIWMGDGFAVSVGLSKLFIVSLFFVSIVSSGTEMMIGLNRIRELILVAGIASIINLLVSIILVRNIGVAGVVVGTVVGSIITAIGYLHRINKAFDLSMTDFWMGVLLRPVLVLLPLLLIYAAIGNLIIADILFIIASPFLLFVMVDKDDRHAFLGHLQARK